MKHLNLIIMLAGTAGLSFACAWTLQAAKTSEPELQPQALQPSTVLPDIEPPQKSIPTVARPSNPQVDFPGFVQLSDEVAAYRDLRKVSLNSFLEMQGENGTIVLDTRSKANFTAKHIAGAVHLNFSELTKADLARVIPSKDTRILIYCNNNFTNNSPFFANKLPSLALNIPTFVTLYGYCLLYTSPSPRDRG